jgi:3-phenylpropionate/trans-cinnamate dioxygenase ferredoxin reductase subunit
MSTAGKVVIVGAGHAGVVLAGLLRQHGFDGDIVMFSSEPDLPYHRPPLSKKFQGENLNQPLRPAEFFTEQRVTLRLNETVTRIDRQAHEVHTSGGNTVAYGTLVLATGATPRILPLPGADLDGVMVLRTLQDSLRMRDTLTDGSRLAIVGGGYIGMEVAAATRTQGIAATILEREKRVLARVASPLLSDILADHHRSHGTDIRTEVGVSGFDGGSDGYVRAVLLEDGSEMPCDAVLVAAGAVPRTELASAADLICDGGIAVDLGAQTNDPDILAIGDATRRPLFGSNVLGRMESIPSATEQARQACATILGNEIPQGEVPWFWSDQFDLKLKIAGLVNAESDVVLRGDPSTGRFAIFHHVDGRIVAIESANSPAEFMAGKSLILSGDRIDVQQLSDSTAKMNNLALI